MEWGRLPNGQPGSFDAVHLGPGSGADQPLLLSLALLLRNSDITLIEEAAGSMSANACQQKFSSVRRLLRDLR